jgi:UDP-N-acetylglucosamine 1-carboxyvinyltransferase
VPELIKMGAKIDLQCGKAVVTGVPKLSGADVVATDLRSGAGLVLAGLSASGYTTVEDIYHIDRGYPKIENDLLALGAEIERMV